MWANNVMGLRRMTHISKCSRVVVQEKYRLFITGYGTYLIGIGI